MFGKAEWFRLKDAGLGLFPASWRGWVYTLTWALVVAVPAVLLIGRNQEADSIVWLAAAVATFFWDLRCIRQALVGLHRSSVLYIGDDGVCESIPASRCAVQAGK